MKKNKLTRRTIIAAIAVFAFWLVFLIIPILHLITDKETLNSISSVYVMIGALFTGLAFAVTYASLLTQNKGLKDQLAMDTLSNTIDLILDSDRFRESRKYVMSKTFYNHVDILKRIKDDDLIYIEDWEKLDNGEKAENTTSEYVNSYKSYEKLIFFCGRMEYMGIVLKNKGVDYTVLDYFGNTIIESYARIEPYITNSRIRFGETYYFHYTYLYNLAKQREPILKQECKDLLDKMAKNELLLEEK